MSSIVLKFTNRLLSKIETPSENTVYRDKNEKGLFLRVSRRGTKIFYLGKKYQKQGLKIKIGPYPDLSVRDARKIARELKTLLAKGIDPREVKRKKYIEENEKRIKAKQEITFEELHNKYIEEYSKVYAVHWKSCAARIHNYAKLLYTKKISKIEREDIEKIFKAISKAKKYSTANAFLIDLGTIFNKAIKWGLIEQNPILGIKKHRMPARERRLTYDEMPKFLQVVKQEKSEIVKCFILLALYTGARKRNVLTMEWSNIDFAKKIWHIPKTKNGKSQDVPLTDDAMEILQGMKVTSKWVLPSDTSKSGHLESPDKTWRKICAKAGIENLRIHDLRRTLASCLADFGASQHTIGIVLNHDDLKTTSIYARVSLKAVRQYMSKVTQMMNECTDRVQCTLM